MTSLLSSFPAEEDRREEKITHSRKSVQWLLQKQSNKAWSCGEKCWSENSINRPKLRGQFPHRHSHCCYANEFLTSSLLTALHQNSYTPVMPPLCDFCAVPKMIQEKAAVLIWLFSLTHWEDRQPTSTRIGSQCDHTSLTARMNDWKHSEKLRKPIRLWGEEAKSTVELRLSKTFGFWCVTSNQPQNQCVPRCFQMLLWASSRKLLLSKMFPSAEQKAAKYLAHGHSRESQKILLFEKLQGNERWFLHSSKSGIRIHPNGCSVWCISEAPLHGKAPAVSWWQGSSPEDRVPSLGVEGGGLPRWRRAA